MNSNDGGELTELLKMARNLVMGDIYAEIKLLNP